jgi:hypothetical protein
MNVLCKELTTATQTLPVIIMTDHLLVHAILDLLETERFVKVRGICMVIYKSTLSHCDDDHYSVLCYSVIPLM